MPFGAAPRCSPKSCQTRRVVPALVIQGQAAQRRMARFWAATLRARAILPQYGVAARSWSTLHDAHCALSCSKMAAGAASGQTATGPNGFGSVNRPGQNANFHSRLGMAHRRAYRPADSGLVRPAYHARSHNTAIPRLAKVGFPGASISTLYLRVALTSHYARLGPKAETASGLGRSRCRRASRETGQREQGADDGAAGHQISV